MSASNHYVISVLLPDRVAILRDISSAVDDVGGNISGISQTVVNGYFSLTLTADIPARMTADTIRAAIICRFPDDPISVVVEPYAATRPAAEAPQGAHYVVTASGPDHGGILKTITAFLAERNINVEDWTVELGDKAVTHVGDVTVPADLDLRQLQEAFRETLSRIGLDGGMQHENIFRATSEIGPIESLLGDADDD
jgi:glycine cleavage system transcriptional repressor